MERFIPYEKLSKKEKRKLDQAKRQTWGELNPVTRKPANSKAYNRKKAQNWKKEFSGSAFFHQCRKQTQCNSVANLESNISTLLFRVFMPIF